MWYSSWLISSAAWSWDWYSAAIHTSAASSTIFLPISCTPASTQATVAEPCVRPATLLRSSAYRVSKLFPAGESVMADHPTADGFDHRVGYASGTYPFALPPLDPQPGHEADNTEPAVHDVHDRRRIIVGLQQQGHSYRINCDPDQPELDPAARHTVCGKDGAGEDPGVGQRAPGAQCLQNEVEQRRQHQRADEQLDPPADSGPLRSDSDTLGCMRLPVLVPADPAVDADHNEEHLAPRLTPQVKLLRCIEGTAYGTADEDREQQHVAHDADGPCGNLAPHAENCACQPEPVPDDLPPQDGARTND